MTEETLSVEGNNQFLSRTEAARLLECREDKVSRLIKDKHLPAEKRGNKYIIKLEDVQRIKDKGGPDVIFGIANPGAALGQKIGELIEQEAHRILNPVARSLGYSYIHDNRIDPETNRRMRLILKDASGNSYNVDALIYKAYNEKIYPFVLVESKNLRYTKHNKDKGSWICNAHPNLRRRHSSLRKSIVILAGNWSDSSKEMLQSHGCVLFEIKFQTIVNTLKNHEIHYKWEENEKEKATQALGDWVRLTGEAKTEIARTLLSGIKDELSDALIKILEPDKERQVNKIIIDFQTNYGEVLSLTFDSIAEAIERLPNFKEQKNLNDEAFRGTPVEVKLVEEGDMESGGDTDQQESELCS
ncbi:MAG TPA: excisionase family DNA-binding protein [Blastocatellia bacterium]|nr:excisionase family DNA-binding protein [Blastocatellia bacterium]